MKPARYHGLFAATLTPMKSNGDVAMDQIGTQIERLIERRVTGLHALHSRWAAIDFFDWCN